MLGASAAGDLELLAQRCSRPMQPHRGIVRRDPRRERHILEFMVKNARRRVTKTQIFNTVYGVFNDDVNESIVEGHMSKLRKKLRGKLGYEVIEAKRFLGYQYLG